MRVLAALVLAVLPLSAPAQGLPGADDPAFAAALGALLVADDPAALTALHGLAEGGNAAATVALATAMGWMTPAMPFAERRRLTRVGGVPVAEAAAALSPAQAAWHDHHIARPEEMIARALDLARMGEVARAGQVARTWANQTGGFGVTPIAYWDAPFPPWDKALLVEGMARYDPGAVEVPTALTAAWLDADRAEGWLAFEGIARVPADGVVLPELAKAARALELRLSGQDAGHVTARRDAARHLRALARGGDPSEVPDASVPGVVALAGDAWPMPNVRAWCAAVCRDAPPACTTAYVAGFGLPFALDPGAQPTTDVLDLAAFRDSPRGRFAVVAAGFRTRGAAAGDPEAIETVLRGPAMTRAIALDACFGEAVRAALPDLVTRRFGG
jgi:hypothetical protein